MNSEEYSGPGDLEALERLMRERRSVRSFTDEAPSEEAIERMLEAAILASPEPRAWRSCVLPSPQLRS